MFNSIGWGEVLVLVVAGLFILGPERLPGAAAWLGRTVRQVREYATGAREQLRSEFGQEFEELRKPLEDLRSLRDLDPRRALKQHLLDGYDPIEDLKRFDMRDELRLNGDSLKGEKPNGYPMAPSAGRKLEPGERPPFDPDAT
ncbi:MAG: Sec-independent protein translocase protein TatB [Sciscionella sp.]